MTFKESYPLKNENIFEIEKKKTRDYFEDVTKSLEKIKTSFKVEIMGEINYDLKKYPIFFVSNKTIDNTLPNVFVSAGVHGNEPAGVYALLDFLEKKAEAYKNKINLFAVPCVNPSGFENNTRETQNNIDINRDFLDESLSPETNIVKKILETVNNKYAFSCDMHEDPYDDIDPLNPFGYIPEDVYFYENSPDKDLSVGQSLIKELEGEGVKFCKEKEIYEEKNEGGVIWTPFYKESGEGENTLEDYLRNYSSHTFTTETSTKLPIEERKNIQIKILCRMLDLFSKKP